MGVAARPVTREIGRAALCFFSLMEDCSSDGQGLRRARALVEHRACAAVSLARRPRSNHVEVKVEGLWPPEEDPKRCGKAAGESRRCKLSRLMGTWSAVSLPTSVMPPWWLYTSHNGTASSPPSAVRRTTELS